MKKKVERTALVAVCATYASLCSAQWTAQDSLKLKQMLEGTDNIELNEHAIRSMEFNANPQPEQPTIFKDYLHFDSTLPVNPFVQETDSLAKSGMTLMPYSGTTRYNYDPIYKKRIEFDKKNKAIDWERELPTDGRKAMEGTRLMMMGGGFGGSFMPDLDRFFSKEFWSFRARRNAKKTLIALKNYSRPEEAEGRYEYYYLNNEDFTLNFTGSQQAEEKVQSKLNEFEPMKKGLLYFKYTADGKGNFTLYLPDDQYVKGTFTRNWLGYRLYCNDMELFVSLSQVGGRYYQLKLNLTKEFRSLYVTDEIQKVTLVATASKVSAGSDKR